MAARERSRWSSLGVAVAFATSVGVAWADLEEDLERAWVGAWSVVRVEVASDCSGFYTNNEVRGRLTSSKGNRRLSEGELARVDKLNLRSDRVDLYLSLAAPVLVPRQDGPFTLYDERSCRVQLMVEMPRSLLKEKDWRKVDAALLEVLERHESAALARQSGGWNRREGDPLPENYQETLARHAVWRAEETNRALARARQDSLEQLTAAVARIVEDADYLAGFAAGVEAQRRRAAPSCGMLATARFEGDEQRPPRDRQGETAADRSFRRGFRDGQLVAWSARLARAVDDCFVPVPPLPR